VASAYGTPVSEAANGRGRAVTKASNGYGTPVAYETIGVAAALATLNGAPVNVTVSNGGLTATHSTGATNSGVSSTAYKSTGKYYFEITATTTHGYSDMAGLMLDSSDFFAFVSQVAGSKLGFGGAVIFTSNSGVSQLAIAPGSIRHGAAVRGRSNRKTNMARAK
jgi:hypothetical protein